MGIWVGGGDWLDKSNSVKRAVSASVKRAVIWQIVLPAQRSGKKCLVKESKWC